MKKGGGSECTIIVGPYKSVLLYALHSLEYVLGLARFRVFVLKLLFTYTEWVKPTAYYIYMATAALMMLTTPSLNAANGEAKDMLCNNNLVSRK